MRGIENHPTIIIKKYRDTGIPQYFVTSSIVDNFWRNKTVRIICNALRILFAIYTLKAIMNCLPLDMVDMFLAFMLEFQCVLMTCCWSHLHAVIYVKQRRLQFLWMRWSGRKCVFGQPFVQELSSIAEMGDRGHNGHGPKRGGAVPISRSAGNPSNTMWNASMSNSVPRGLFIHPAVWPQ